MVIVANSTEGLQEKSEDRSTRQTKQEWPLRDAQQHLIQKLQTSLELGTVLRLFYDTIQHVVRLDGLKYTFDGEGIVHTFGEARQHNAEYKVSSDAQELGVLSFSRSQRFAEAELAALEILIGSLYFPLRNALLYRQAVQSSMKD